MTIAEKPKPSASYFEAIDNQKQRNFLSLTEGLPQIFTDEGP